MNAEAFRPYVGRFVILRSEHRGLSGLGATLRSITEHGYLLLEEIDGDTMVVDPSALYGFGFGPATDSIYSARAEGEGDRREQMASAFRQLADRIGPKPSVGLSDEEIEQLTGGAA